MCKWGLAATGTVGPRVKMKLNRQEYTINSAYLVKYYLLIVSDFENSSSTHRLLHLELKDNAVGQYQEENTTNAILRLAQCQYGVHLSYSSSSASSNQFTNGSKAFTKVCLQGKH